MSIKDNYNNVIARIEACCQRANVDVKSVKLVTVTKTHSPEIMLEALDAGAKVIGENKIQDSKMKLPLVAGHYDEFHFIGHLQSNKIKQLVPLKPTLIHSIDKLSTASKLSEYCLKNNVIQDILIQINTTNEDSKSGTGELEAIKLIEEIAQLPNIKIKGLMTIGLFDNDPEVTRPYFRNLKRIFDLIKSKNIPNVEMEYLSMGMSHDFEIAIEEGANIIRVGSSIFGARNYNK